MRIGILGSGLMGGKLGTREALRARANRARRRMRTQCWSRCIAREWTMS